MGPLGIICVAVGAILYWAVDVNISHLDENALGVILMVGGILLLLGAALMRSRRDDSDISLGAVLILLGAILRWAVDADIPRIDDNALGVVLMVTGVLAIVVALTMPGYRGETTAELALVLIGLGAAVVWALKIDLPYVNDDALGFILMIAGVIGLAAAVVSNERDRRDRRARSVPMDADGRPVDPAAAPSRSRWLRRTR
ncbi:MAG: hypothetical protein FWE71_02145 [Nocardioidaceae bacterium]|nr:hypothetical protein [Nocardioidaceae bacterium]MCL2613387.1 hypothetical protein [Nocardioidaceae bacterium]